MLIDDAIETAIRSFAGKPFRARGIAKLVGEDVRRIEKHLEQRVRDGTLRSRIAYPSYENGLPYRLYAENIHREVSAHRRSLGI